MHCRLLSVERSNKKPCSSTKRRWGEVAFWTKTTGVSYASFTLQPVLSRTGSARLSTDKHTVHTINSATELRMRNTRCYASTATVVSLLRVHTPRYKLLRRIVLQMADPRALLAFCELPTRRTLHSRQRACESGMLRILRSRRTFTTRVLLLAIVSALYTNALLNTARPRVVWTMPR